MSEKILVQVDTVSLIWKCPVCGRETESGVGEAIESGNPLCIVCLEAGNEIEMEFSNQAEARIYEKTSSGT